METKRAIVCAQRASDAQSKAMSRSQIILHAHLPRTCRAHASTPQQALREAALAAPCARMQNACTIAFPAPTFLRKTRKNAAHPTTRAGARYSSLAPGSSAQTPNSGCRTQRR